MVRVLRAALHQRVIIVLLSGIQGVACGRLGYETLSDGGAGETLLASASTQGDATPPSETTVFSGGDDPPPPVSGVTSQQPAPSTSIAPSASVSPSAASSTASSVPPFTPDAGTGAATATGVSPSLPNTVDGGADANGTDGNGAGGDASAPAGSGSGGFGGAGGAAGDNSGGAAGSSGAGGAGGAGGNAGAGGDGAGGNAGTGGETETGNDPGSCALQGGEVVTQFDTPGTFGIQVSGPGTLNWSDMEGNPNAGALDLDNPEGGITGLTAASSNDLTGRVLMLNVLVEGGSDATMYLYAQSQGASSPTAVGELLNPSVRDWYCLRLNLAEPSSADAEFDAAQIVLLGLRVESTGPVRLYIDQVAY